MKEATSGGTGRNYVVVEAHRCAKGTQPPGTVGYLAMVLERGGGGGDWNRKIRILPIPGNCIATKEISIAVSKQDANTFKEE